MDKEHWLFINSFAPWFAALGTVSAVLVSLRLARRGERSRLSIRIGPRQIVMVGDRLVVYEGGKPLANSERCVVLGVVNMGWRTAQVSALYWHSGYWWGRRRAAMLPSLHPGSSKLPIVLEEGEKATFIFPVENDYVEQLRNLVGNGASGWLRLRSLHVVVKTTREETFLGRPDRGLRQMLSPERCDLRGGASRVLFRYFAWCDRCDDWLARRR